MGEKELQFVHEAFQTNWTASTLSFIASASPIIFLGAKPVFIDSDQTTWNMDPALLAEEIKERAGRNQLPKAVIILVILLG